MRWWIAVLAPMISMAAIDRQPPNCSTRPCTYTLTCASAICTSAESAELQTVLNEAHLGDTIRLQAGRTWTGTSSNYRITGRPGSGWLTITTTLDDRLPLPGTRITPHYRSVMPTIRNGSGVANALLMAAGANPARYIRIVGVRFDAQSGAAGLVKVDGTSSDPDTQAPMHIVIDRCIVENSTWNINVGTLITVIASRVEVLNSYLQGSIKQPGAEVQNMIYMYGPAKVLNNYMADNLGENFITGGSAAPIFIDKEPWTYTSGEFAYNAVLNHRARVPHLNWQPNTPYFKNGVVRYNGVDYRATYSGISGSTFSTYDNGIQWVQTSSLPTSKNLFELKTAAHFKIHHNTFDGFWTKAQACGIVFKVSNSSGNPLDCVPNFSGTVNVSGDTVTPVGQTVLPDLWNGSKADGSSCAITINGTNYTVKRFDSSPHDGGPSELRLTAAAPTMSNVPFSYGYSAGCPGAWLKNVSFEHNVVRNVPQAFQIIALNNARLSRVGNIRVRNNLMYRIDRNEFCMLLSNCALAVDAVWLAQLPYGVDFSNNTVIDVSSNPYGLGFTGAYHCRHWCRTVEPCISSSGYMVIAGDTRVTNNIVAKGATDIWRSTDPGVDRTLVDDLKICDGGCTVEKWAGNILVGANISSGFPAQTYNLCPTSGGCAVNYDYDDPVWGKLFELYSVRNLRIRSSHYAARGGARGDRIGADWDALPIVTRPSDGGIGVDIETTATTATFRYRVTAPIRHIPCVVEVSSALDMEGDLPVPGFGRIPDLDPATYLRPDVDGTGGSINRQIVVGTRVPLESGRTYYYRLHCGGAFHEGEFTTQ